MNFGPMRLPPTGWLSLFAVLFACAQALNHNTIGRRKGWSLNFSTEKEQSLAPESVVLPIFPLRKSIKLPTELLKLSLYEPRYLEMSKYILSQEHRIFGAVYCSDKPQVIKNGEGPIVPMLQKGDTGVVCWVFHHELDRVPTRDGQHERELIRLFAVAGPRFQVDKLLSSGYNNDSPYIVAKGTTVCGLSDSASTLDCESVANNHLSACKSFMATNGFVSEIPGLKWIENRYRACFGTEELRLSELAEFSLAASQLDETDLGSRRRFLIRA